MIISLLPFADISSTFTVTEIEQHSNGPSRISTGCAGPLFSLTSYVEDPNCNEMSIKDIMFHNNHITVTVLTLSFYCCTRIK